MGKPQPQDGAEILLCHDRLDGYKHDDEAGAPLRILNHALCTPAAVAFITFVLAFDASYLAQLHSERSCLSLP